MHYKNDPSILEFFKGNISLNITLKELKLLPWAKFDKPQVLAKMALHFTTIQAYQKAGQVSGFWSILSW